MSEVGGGFGAYADRQILHLEDDDNDAILVREFLEVDGLKCAITRVRSGEEFAEAIDSKRFHAILSDYTIPGYSGMSALRLAHNKHPDTPFIFVSGTIGEDVAIESLIGGATDYVLKQRPARLASALRRALEEAEACETLASQRKLQEFQAALLRNVSDALLAVDERLNLRYWNEAARRFFNLPSDLATGESVRGLGMEDIAFAIERLSDSEHFSLDSAMEVSRQSSSGEIYWGLAKFSEIREPDNGTTGFLVVIRDITDRKKYIERLIDLNEELERRVSIRTNELSNANRELQSFGYTVSHDLQAPLRAMRGYAELLLEEYPTAFPDDARDMLHRIVAAGNRMRQLIEGLMSLSKLTRTSLQLNEVDLSGLAKSVSMDLSEIYPERQIRWEIQPGIVAQADPNLMRSALENLFSNAIKFTATRTDAVIQFRADDSQGKTVYYVRDNGVGFDSKAAPAIFDAFTRLHRDDEYPGTGVGLATVDRIIRRHGGEVWAEAELGVGATILFTLAANGEPGISATADSSPT